MMILSFTGFLNSSSFWNNLITIVGGIIGVISILVTIISIFGTLSGTFSKFRQSSPKYSKQPCEPKESASVTRIAIWNSGKTLLPSDLMKKAPLCIKVNDENTRIIDCSLIYSEEKNDIRYLRPTYDGKVVNFTFDLLRNNEGFVVDVVHTGRTCDVDVQGSLIEGGDILFIPPIPRKRSVTMSIIGASSAIVYSVGFIMFLAGYFSFLYEFPWIIIAIFAAMFPSMIFMSISLIKTSFNSIFIPQKIDKILFNS